jgi:hypothetical protein
LELEGTEKQMQMRAGRRSQAQVRVRVRVRARARAQETVQDRKMLRSILMKVQELEICLELKVQKEKTLYICFQMLLQVNALGQLLLGAVTLLLLVVVNVVVDGHVTGMLHWFHCLGLLLPVAVGSAPREKAISEISETARPHTVIAAETEIEIETAMAMAMGGVQTKYPFHNPHCH